MLRKNGDWTVILGDIAHWATSTPQVFVLIIGGLAVALVVALYHGQPTQTARYQTPNIQYVPAPQPTPTPDTSAPTPPLDPLSQQLREQHVQSVLPMYRGIQFKNKCPADYIFFDSLQGCTAILPYDRIRMEAGNTFTLSPTRIVNLLLVRGSIHLKNAIHPIGDTFAARINIRTQGGQITALTPTGFSITNTN